MLQTMPFSFYTGRCVVSDRSFSRTVSRAAFRVVSEGCHAADHKVRSIQDEVFLQTETV